MLEIAEARVLAHNFKNVETLNMGIQRFERIYGKGSAERIKEHMRHIWKQEMCK